jgi:hypothetical protein
MSLLLASVLVLWIVGTPVLVVAAAAALPRVMRRRERNGPAAPVAQLFAASERPHHASSVTQLRARR